MMKRLLMFFTLGMLSLCFFVVGCDEDDQNQGGDGDMDGPPWSCHFDQDMTGLGAKGCYEYDESVSEDDARAACQVHKIGAVLDRAENRVLRGGSCDLELVSGFCVCSCHPLPGREYLQYKEEYTDDPSLDCVMDPDEINSIFGCEENVGGAYTCTIAE
jgi:hypothetical protein